MAFPHEGDEHSSKNRKFGVPWRTRDKNMIDKKIRSENRAEDGSMAE
jgi:hypothetical protein